MKYSPAKKRAAVKAIAFCIGSVLLGVTPLLLSWPLWADDITPAPVQPPVSVEQARAQAGLLHDSLAATLDVVHHTYYREDEGLLIPAAALSDVFEEVERKRGVKLRWLAVDAQAMNVAHTPADDFEKEAVKALTAGDEQFEQVTASVYRRAGRITLDSECLKCHLPNRTSTKPRTAGLIIAIPVQPAP